MKYSEFSDPCLVAIYDTVNPIAEYRAFYIELAAKLAGARQVSSIVDIGCGSGQLTCELAKQGHHLIGVEPSSAMLNLARRRTATDLVAAELTAADIGTVEWIHGGAQSLGAFDADLAVMTGHVAQFFLEDEIWHGALASIYKALKPGGYLVFESRNPIVQPFLMASRQTAVQESDQGSDRESDHVDWPSETNRRRVIDPVAGAVEWWFQLLSVEGDRVLYEIHYLFEKTGEKAISTNELRFRTRGELEANLVAAGFTVECVYGNWDFQLAEAGSPEFIFVAKAAEF
ncbi:MAG: class I SAM-dependent methyltransferase [Candidatus Obscuribacterales bacterium]